jgi:hypothetical protein
VVDLGGLELLTKRLSAASPELEQRVQLMGSRAKQPEVYAAKIRLPARGPLSTKTLIECARAIIVQEGRASGAVGTIRLASR